MSGSHSLPPARLLRRTRFLPAERHVRVHRDDVDGVRLVGVNVDRTEVGGQVAIHLLPGIAGVRAERAHAWCNCATTSGFALCIAMRYSPPRKLQLGQVGIFQAAVDRLPGLAAVVGAEGWPPRWR